MKKEIAEKMLNEIEKLNSEVISKQNELDSLLDKYQELTGDVEEFEETNEISEEE